MNFPVSLSMIALIEGMGGRSVGACLQETSLGPSGTASPFGMFHRGRLTVQLSYVESLKHRHVEGSRTGAFHSIYCSCCT